MTVFIESLPLHAKCSQPLYELGTVTILLTDETEAQFKGKNTGLGILEPEGSTAITTPATAGHMMLVSLLVK